MGSDFDDEVVNTSGDRHRTHGGPQHDRSTTPRLLSPKSVHSDGSRLRQALVQAKLSVGPVGDCCKPDAGDVADAVMRDQPHFSPLVRPDESDPWQIRGSRVAARESMPSTDLRPVRLSPIQRARHGVIRRMDDSEYMDTSDDEVDDEEYSEGEEQADLTGPNVDAAALGNWLLGVVAGMDIGWVTGIDQLVAGLDAPRPNVAARMAAMGWHPPAGAVAAAQIPPPGETVFADEAYADGQAHGEQLGLDVGMAEAARALGWNRTNYPAIPAADRLAAIAMNGGTCVYCNAAPSTQADHVYPVQRHYVTIGYLQLPAVRGQVNHPSNLVGSCGPCNGGKGNTYLAAWVAAGGGGHLSAAWAAAMFPHGAGVAAAIPAQRFAAATPATW